MSKTACWWKDLLLVVAACVVGNAIGALASWRIYFYIMEGIEAREGPGPSVGDLRFPLTFFACQLCGGLLGPFLTYLAPTRSPQFLTKAVVSVGFGMVWVLCILKLWDAL